MAEPADSPLPYPGTLEQFVSGQHNFVVYTHGARTRQVIALLFVFYLVFFSMFLGSIFSHFEELENLPTVFASVEASEGNLWLGYIVAGAGVTIATAFLLYFTWAVVDIWGLQVCLSPVELRIQNTITLNLMPRLMGVGRLPMEDIATLRGGRFLTYISGKGVTLRFSPVENVDNLIAGILSHAPEAKVVE